MWSKITIGRQIGIGFTVVLALLVAVGVISLRGVAQIVGNAEEVIGGNKLDGTMAQKEVDHLNWASQVSALLTDDSVTVLTAQTDPRRCGFGTWLYGDERKAAERDLPTIAPLLREIEHYHSDLHASAVEIAAHFKPADPLLPGKLSAREVDHLAWVSKVKDLFLLNQPALEVETDPTRCKLGLWLAGEDARGYAEADSQFGRLLETLEEPHKRLHRSAVAIDHVWKQRHPGLQTTLLARLDDHRSWTAKVCRACALE
ncbi:MAG TPA: CZB domain-containing protein, partial [Phycisphaerae bacterium]|nr:CZB domain-containing protein [Phycisphaerae bacterium]